MRSALFRLLTRLAVHHGGAVLLVAAAFTAVTVFLTSRLEVKTNFKDMLGPDDPISQKLTYFEENFPAFSSMRILLEGRDPERLIAVGEAIEARLRADPAQIRDVILERPVDFFLDHGLLYLQEDDLRFGASVLDRHRDQVAALFGDPSTLGLLALLDRTLASQGRPAGAVLTLQSRAAGGLDLSGPDSSAPAMDLKSRLDTRPFVSQLNDEMIRVMRDTPLPGSPEEMKTMLGGMTLALGGLADVLEQGERLSDADFERRADVLRGLAEDGLGLPMTRYALSPKRDALVIDVVPQKNILALAEAKPFLTWMEGELDTIRTVNPDVSISPTGLPVILKQESEAINKNLTLVTVLGFLGILAVFIVGFERIGLPSLAAIPLLISNAWTFGIVSAAHGQITLFALTFPVLLFGLGVDYAIHLLSGYSEQRKAGHPPEEALQRTFDTVGDGLLTGALTCAMAFLVMLGSDFYGLRDMGFTSGLGVLMSLLAMLTVLPALLILWDRRAGARGEVLPQVPFTFLGPVGDRVRRHRYIVLAVFLTITLVFAYFAKGVRLDQNYMNILPRGLPAAATQARVLELYGTSNEFMVFRAANLEEAERIRVAALASPTVSEVISPSTMVPTGQEQKAQAIRSLQILLDELSPTSPPTPHAYAADEISTLRTHLAGLKVSALGISLIASTLYGDDVRDAAAALRQAINRVDARADPSSASRLVRLDHLLAARMARELERFRGMTQNVSLSADQLPAALLNQLRGRDGEWLVLVRARGDVWDETFRTSFLSDLDAIGADHVGMVAAWDSGVASLIHELPIIFSWTCVIVGLLVLADLRSIKQTILALMPLTVTMIWTVGLVGVMGWSFNIVSVLSLPLLVGIAIDNAVHLTHRIRHDGSLASALVHSGKPLMLTSSTAMIGFGSLMLTIHPGIYGLGFLTCLGMGFSLGISLLMLPALIAIFAEELLVERGGEE